MSDFSIEQAWEPTPESEGFYVLRGGTNWASVEGFASEWVALAAAVRSRGRASFSRCTVVVTGRWADFWSPRNCVGDGDIVNVPLDAADRLATDILDTLRRHGEACVADPCPSGA